MKNLLDWFRKNNFAPFIIALAFIIFIIWLFWWLNQPIEIIYDKNASPYPYSLGGDDYH